MIKRTASNSLLLSFLITNSCYAAQEIDVMPDQDVEATISREDLSRIKVEGDRIRTLRCNEGELEFANDQILGEVYIIPKTSSPINLFVITEKNHTYKLLLIPQKIPSEQIFLKSKFTEAPKKARKEEGHQRLMKAMMNKAELQDYENNLLPGEVEYQDMTLVQLAKYEGEQYIGYAFEVWEHFEEESVRKANVIATSLGQVTDGTRVLYVVEEKR